MWLARLGLALATVLFLFVAACSSSTKSNSSSGPTVPTTPPPSTPTTARAPRTTTNPPGTLTGVHVALRTVASGLDSPVALAWRAHDPRIYVAEQPGRVRVVATNGHPLAQPVLTLTGLSHGNEQGLLGIVFSNDGTKLYTDSTDAANNTHVDEYTMKGDVADPATKRQVLFQNQPANNHNGGELAIGPDGLLYIGLGDGGFEGDPQRNGQKLSTLLSKILRINPNASGGSSYTVPSDNPFVGHASARAETWMWGLRNPWRFSFDRATGDLWIGDVGQNKYEEIDYAAAGEKGINFGWSVREALHPFSSGSAPGARDPLFELAHTDGYCAVVGGYVYRGHAIPALAGDYVFGDDCNSELGVAAQNNGKLVGHQGLGVQVSQLTSFGEDPSGEIYAVSRTGTVYEFTKA